MMSIDRKTMENITARNIAPAPQSLMQDDILFEN